MLGSILPMRQEYANQLLADSHAGYEKIASDFSHTRGWFWPELRFVADLIPKNGNLLDIGCGNGRFLTLLDQPKNDTEDTQNISYTGIDFSENLINVARERYAKRAQTNFIIGDALKLPFPNQSFDAVASFAVLHHIPSRAYRVQFLREASRVAKPESLIILTAWNVWRAKPWTIVKFIFKKILRQTRTDFGDALLGFNNEKNTRFVHALTIYEIRSLAREANLNIERIEKIRRPSGEENFFVMLRT